MDKDFGFIHKECSVDNAIDCAKAICEEWRKKKTPSIKIVASAKQALSSMKKKKTQETRIVASVYLLALDMRIRERYKGFLWRILLYFSLRREMRILTSLLNSLDISKAQDGIRSAIEIEIQRIRESIKKKSTDGEDEIRGGKKSQKSEEPAEDLVADDPEETAEASEEGATEEISEEGPEADKARELEGEKTDAISEESQDREAITEKNAESTETENSLDDNSEFLAEENIQINEEQINLGEENNGLGDKSEPRTDKSNEYRTYNDAVDIPLFFEEKGKAESTVEKRHFIDELIMDNIVKGQKNSLDGSASEKIRQDGNKIGLGESGEQRGEERGNAEKDAHLYDKMLFSDKTSNADKSVTAENQAQTAQTTQTAKDQTTQSQASQPQTNQSLTSNETRIESDRTPIKVDIAAQAEENKARGSIGENMPEEELQQFYDMQASVMREQLKILSDEIGMEAPVEIIGLADEAPQKSTGAELNRK